MSYTKRVLCLMSSYWWTGCKVFEDKQRFDFVQFLTWQNYLFICGYFCICWVPWKWHFLYTGYQYFFSFLPEIVRKENLFLRNDRNCSAALKDKTFKERSVLAFQKKSFYPLDLLCSCDWASKWLILTLEQKCQSRLKHNALHSCDK